MSEPLLSLKNVRAGYGDGPDVLHPFTLDIAPIEGSTK